MTTNQLYLWDFTWGRKQWTLDMLKIKQNECIELLRPICKQLVVQGEKAASGMYHLQGFFQLHSKKRDSELIKQLQLPGGFRISPNHDSGASKKYCQKSDTRVLDTYFLKPPKIDYEYKGEDLPKDLCKWQSEMQRVSMTKPHPRTIWWLYDPAGRSGKSTFCKYMAYHHNAVALNWGDSKDMLYIVSSKIAKFGPAATYIFDLTRTKPKLFSSDDLYASIEQIKNGSIVNTKYEANTVLFDIPHIFILSNSLPEMEKLTKDRWKVIKIRDEDKKLVDAKCQEDTTTVDFGEPATLPALVADHPTP